MGIGTSSSSPGARQRPRTRMLPQSIVTRLSWGGIPAREAATRPAQPLTTPAGPMHVIFWVGADHGAERLGEGGEGDVAVPAGERAALQVVPARAGLHAWVAIPRPPAHR